MKYMKNRSGVVFQLKQDLLENPKLEFVPCSVEGVTLKREPEAPLEERLAAKQMARKPKKSRKKRDLLDDLDPGSNPDEE